MKKIIRNRSSVKNVERSLRVPADMTLSSVNAVRLLLMAGKIICAE